MSDLTQFLPDPALAFLNFCVMGEHYINHLTGGWGPVIFLFLIGLAGGLPVERRAAQMEKAGMSPEEVARGAAWVGAALFIVLAPIFMYVSSHF